MSSHRVVLGAGVVAIVGWLAAANILNAEEPIPYDGIQAGLDAYARHEGQRLGYIGRQVTLVDEMKWWSHLNRYGRGFGPYPPGAVAPSLDSIYAAAGARLPRYRTYDGRLVTSDIFEPWPLMPGDIWGGGFYDPVEQPVGHRSIQTGPDRYEYHPIYEEELEPAVDVAPPPVEPEDEPPPRTRVPPPLPEEPSFGEGPREF